MHRPRCSMKLPKMRRSTGPNLRSRSILMCAVMTPPAKAGSFSGNGMTCSEGVAVYRWRLKAPSEPWSKSEPQDIHRGVQVSTDAQAAGTGMPALAERHRNTLPARRTGLRRAGGIHLYERPTSFRRFVGHNRDELAP